MPQARSCFSTDFLISPAATSSAVYPEAGDKQAAQRWTEQMIRVHPSFKWVRKSDMATLAVGHMLSSADSGPASAGDFPQSLMVLGNTKRNAASILETFGQNRDMILPALDYPAPPEIVFEQENGDSRGQRLEPCLWL